MHYVGYAGMAAAVSNAGFFFLFFLFFFLFFIWLPIGGLGIITALTVAQPPRGAGKERRKEKTHQSTPSYSFFFFLQRL